MRKATIDVGTMLEAFDHLAIQKRVGAMPGD